DVEMLAIARQRCPTVPFINADMVDFDLGQKFDVVTCLFSSIGYVRDQARLNQAVLSMAAHLGPNGVLLLEPWVLRENWTTGHVQVVEAENDGMRAVRMIVSTSQGNVSVLDTHYLVAGRSGIEHFV